MMAARPQPRVTPVLNGDEARYRRRYRTLKDMVNDLSDESNLLALRVHQIQRRMYDAHMLKHGTPPPAISVPDGASWVPLVQNASHYPSDVGAIKRPPRNQMRRQTQTQSQSESRTPSTSPPVEERRNGLARPARPAKGRSRGLGSRKRARSPEVRRGRSESLNGDEDDEDEEEEEEEEEEREERPRSSHRRARTEEEEEEDDEEGESGSEQNVDAEIEDMMDDY